jgi:hypothetical protein
MGADAQARAIVLGPWIRGVMRIYGAAPPEPGRSRPLAIVLGCVVAVLAALAPLLLRLDPGSYPGDPRKLRALNECARGDPTFLRFLPRDRASCYERFHELSAQAAE